MKITLKQIPVKDKDHLCVGCIFFLGECTISNEVFPCYNIDPVQHYIWVEDD